MKVAVFGAGTMGSGIAQVFATAGNETLLFASSVESAKRHKDKLAKSLEKRVEKGKMTVEAKDAIRNFKNPITGEYVMEVFDIKPCNTIGQLKEIVKNAILDGEIENTFEAADAYMRVKAVEMGLTPVK